MSAPTAPETPSIDIADLRKTCGRFASGVTIILTEDEEIHGMTANGFTSVSLDPPLVLISVGNHTRSYERLMHQDHYSVSVLGHEQMVHANHFAGRPTDLQPQYDRIGGFPVIPGAVARMVCRIVDRHLVGDHTLFIGHVEHLDHCDGLPLVFSSGRLFSPLDENRP
jgi:flavin reductase (DIM6/NTAB) family NADH-FMN oxidoreductase RutF